ncbi:hypothetical protein [Jiella sonneratiae]|uniref:LTXXQ motif family protein n=1 Tax=Jiella sonneratiae TaxID=2816856 RepID=A0ABS3J3V9_9HYPH|nr:hypothetical protein [Jiella sonneratiae]MBO0904370.1 hypothetical protein [Jiella sonneratiae]
MRSIRDKNPGNGRNRFGRGGRIATGAALAAALFGTSAFAEQNMPQAGHQPAAKMRSDDGAGAKGHRHFAENFDRGHGGHGGRHHGRRGGMMSPARLATALAALETGIGIQPDQMGAWRNFTGALIAFAEAVQPPMGRPGMGPGRMGPGPHGPGGPGTPQAGGQPGAGADQTPPPPPAGDAAQTDQAGKPGGNNELFAFRMLDHFADRAIEAGEKAKAVKSALADLESTLTPEQTDRARTLIRSMMQEMRGERWGGRGHRGPGDHRGFRFGGQRHGHGPRGPMPQDDGMGFGGPGGPGDDGPDGQGPADQGPETPPTDEAPQQG